MALAAAIPPRNRYTPIAIIEFADAAARDAIAVNAKPAASTYPLADSVHQVTPDRSG